MIRLIDDKFKSNKMGFFSLEFIGNYSGFYYSFIS